MDQSESTAADRDQRRSDVDPVSGEALAVVFGAAIAAEEYVVVVKCPRLVLGGDGDSALVADHCRVAPCQRTFSPMVLQVDSHGYS